MGLAVGPRPPGLAHRVLGDGGGAARARVRDPRRRARPRLPAPRERAGPVARARPRVRAALDAQRAARLAGEKMSKSVGNIVSSATRSRRGGARRCSLFFMTARWRSPMDFYDEVLEQASRSRRASAMASASRAGAGRRMGASSRPRSTTTSTRRRCSRCCPAGATTSCCAAPSTSSGSRRWPSRGGAGRGPSSSPAGGEAARAWATSARPTACAPRSRPRAGTCATSRSPASSSSRSLTADQVYGRRPVREALRGRRKVLELWATERALDAEPWLAEAGVELQVKPERDLTEAAGTRDHQGVLACVRAVPLRRRVRARGAPEPLLAASTRSPTRTTSARSSAARRAPARPGSSCRRTTRRASRPPCAARPRAQSSTCRSRW